MKRILTVLLVFCMLCTPLISAAYAADQVVISSGAGLSISDSTPKEFIISYKPSMDVRPVVFYGETLYGRTNMDEIRMQLVESGEQPVAGINASFFDMATGIPIGMEITDGILRSSGSGICIGIQPDGKMIIGDPGVDIIIKLPDGSVESALYNRIQTNYNGFVLYSNDFDNRVKGTGEVYAIVLKTDKDQLKIGSTVSATVQQITTGSGVDIPEGCFVLTERTDGYDSIIGKIRGIKPGQTITIQVKAKDEWSKVSSACGAGEMLVENSAVCTDFNLDSAEKKTSRTALGLKSDGSAIFYVVDGNAEDTEGKTLQELAERMKELGCVKAVNLDGGGSSTVCILENGKWETVNSPSDGSQRDCANFLFLIYDVGSIRVAAPNRPVMTGAKIKLDVSAASPSGISIPTPENVSGKATKGTVSGMIYNAPNQAGTDTIQLTRGDLKAECSVQVLAPDRIQLEDSLGTRSGQVLKVDADSKTDLNALASFNGQSLISSDDSFAWTCDEWIGTVNGNGVFTATSDSNTQDGTIKVSVGNYEEVLDIIVNQSENEAIDVIAGFEAGETLPGSSTRNTNRSYVRYEAASLALNHGTGKTDFGWAIPLKEGQRRLGVWVYGDGSGAELSVHYTGGGNSLSASFGKIAFTGWRYLRARLEDGASQISGLTISGAASTGTIYLDQLIASRYSFTDQQAPVLKVQSGSSLSVEASDVGTTLSKESILITIDSQPLSFQWSDGRATASLPQDGKMHKLSVYASDAAGNLAAEAVTVPGAVSQPFKDTSSHWANSSISYLGERGILNGSVSASGEKIYRPEDSMTRQEFVVAAVGALGVDLEQYRTTTLPFADLNRIASWALPYCKAAYALGLLNGSSNGGALYCNPSSTITRQEAMAILARTQQKGYEENDLSAFSDASSIDSWARSDIAVMVQRGIISGSGGLLSPKNTVTRAQVAQILYQLY